MRVRVIVYHRIMMVWGSLLVLRRYDTTCMQRWMGGYVKIVYLGGLSYVGAITKLRSVVLCIAGLTPGMWQIAWCTYHV